MVRLVAGVTPHVPVATLGTKKPLGKLMVIVLRAPSQLALEAGSAVAVVKAKVADCAVLEAMRLAQGMAIETAVTWLCAVPTVPVAEQLAL